MPQPDHVIIASYNIRKAIGRDGRRNPGRIIDVIGTIGADVVALQEADFRFGGRRAILDAADLRAATGLHAIDVAPDVEGLGWHGNVLLLSDRVIVHSVNAIELAGSEPRGAVVTDLEIAGKPLRLIQCHLGLIPHQRARQARALMGKVNGNPTIVLGDFNAGGRRPPTLKDLRAKLTEVSHGPTFPTRWPLIRFDRMFHSDRLHASEPIVVDTLLARVASDHLPIGATFGWT